VRKAYTVVDNIFAKKRKILDMSLAKKTKKIKKM
jgi:hypothetical protein